MYSVLLIDDEAWVMEDIKILVDWHELGFDIIGECKNIDEAKKIILTQKPDLVISDIRMPGMSGIEFLESFTSLYNIKTIFVTAFGTFEYAKKALELGAFGYLLKPVEADDLKKNLEKVKQVLDDERGLVEKIKWLEKAKFVYSLVDGYNNAEEIEDEFNSMGMKIDAFNVVLVVKSNKQINSGILNFGDSWKSYEIPMSSRKTLVIIQSIDNKLNIIKYKNLIRSIKKIADDNNFTVGVSRLFNNAKKIRYGFVQADTACDTSFINMKNVVVFCDGQINEKSIKNFINYGKINKNMEEVIDKLPDVLIKNKINIDNFMPILQFLAIQISVQSDIEGLDSKELVNQFKDIRSFFEYILTCMNENVKRGGRKATSQYVIKEIIEHIKSNYNQKLMINSLAQKFFLNSSYLSNLFKQETGKSFTNYLVEFRLNKAEELLENTDLSLYEISSMVGYDDYFHFSKLFKKYKDTSPANYRKEKLKNKFQQYEY